MIQEIINNEAGYRYGDKIPAPSELKEEIPISTELKKSWESKVSEITDILSGESTKFIIISGPCSADLREPVMEHANLQGELQKQVPNLVILQRVYTIKPRTEGTGYKGKAIYPDPNGKANLAQGLRSVRKLHIDTLVQTGLLTADEMVTPDNYDYLDDIIGYIAIGARTATSQHHLEVSSGAFVPVGVKNTLRGSINEMVNGTKAVQAKQNYIGREDIIRHTNGNPYAHGILRGSNLDDGSFFPNYHFEDLTNSLALIEKKGLKNPAIIVDCNHGNSGKKHDAQPRIARSVLTDMGESDVIFVGVKGLMIESYLHDGSQKAEAGKHYTPGISITDPCLGWEKTRTTLLDISDRYAKLQERYR